jgi:hypothetical protein
LLRASSSEAEEKASARSGRYDSFALMVLRLAKFAPKNQEEKFISQI